jgi:hypothetical protein
VNSYFPKERVGAYSQASPTLSCALVTKHNTTSHERVSLPSYTMSSAQGWQPPLATATNDAQNVQFGTSLVPSKRKAAVDSSMFDESFRSISDEEFANRLYSAAEEEAEYEQRAYSDYLNEIYYEFLEEEEAIRVQAELESMQCTTPSEQEFMDDGDDTRDPRFEDDPVFCQDLGYGEADLEAYHDILQEEEDIRAQAECETENNLSDFDSDIYYADMDAQYEEEAEDDFHDESNLTTEDDEHFEMRVRSKISRLNTAEYQEGLCKPCRAVRWSALARMSLFQDHLVYKLRGSPLKLQESDCKLCRFLGTIGSGRVSSDDPRDEEAYLDLTLNRSHSTNAKFMTMSFNGGADDKTLITIHSTKDNKKWHPPLIDPEVIDYGMLREIAAQCRLEHSDCRPSSVPQLKGFKVIDCHLREVIAAPADCQYVALSYVWGKHTDNGCFPVTIEDSFRVTKSMGYRYLWVDRYVRV